MCDYKLSLYKEIKIAVTCDFSGFVALFCKNTTPHMMYPAASLGPVLLKKV